MHTKRFSDNLHPDDSVEAEKITEKILRFCKTPKTHIQVATRFKVPGLSAAVCLKNLRHKGLIEKGKHKTWVATKKKSK